jgi:hypothetical protein
MITSSLTLQKWLKGGKYFMAGYLTFLWVFNTIIAIIQPYLYSSDEVCSEDILFLHFHWRYR